MPDGPRRRHTPVVTPAEAGVQMSGLGLDSGFRRNDGRAWVVCLWSKLNTVHLRLNRSR